MMSIEEAGKDVVCIDLKSTIFTFGKVCINKNFDDILGFKLPSGWEFSNKIYSKPHVTIGKIYDVYKITNNYSQNLLLRGKY